MNDHYIYSSLNELKERQDRLAVQLNHQQEQVFKLSEIIEALLSWLEGGSLEEVARQRNAILLEVRAEIAALKENYQRFYLVPGIDSIVSLLNGLENRLETIEREINANTATLCRRFDIRKRDRYAPIEIEEKGE